MVGLPNFNILHKARCHHKREMAKDPSLPALIAGGSTARRSSMWRGPRLCFALRLSSCCPCQRRPPQSRPRRHPPIKPSITSTRCSIWPARSSAWRTSPSPSTSLRSRRPCNPVPPQGARSSPHNATCQWSFPMKMTDFLTSNLLNAASLEPNVEIEATIVSVRPREFDTAQPRRSSIPTTMGKAWC